MSSVGARLGASSSSGGSVGAPDLSGDIEARTVAVANARMEEMLIVSEATMARNAYAWSLASWGALSARTAPMAPSYQIAPTSAYTGWTANYSSSVPLSVGPAGYGSASGWSPGAADAKMAHTLSARRQVFGKNLRTGVVTAVGAGIAGAAGGYGLYVGGSAAGAWAGNTFRLTVSPRVFAWYLAEGVPTVAEGVYAAGSGATWGHLAGATKVIPTATAVATAAATVHVLE